jgi:hypothetical protein
VRAPFRRVAGALVQVPVRHAGDPMEPKRAADQLLPIDKIDATLAQHPFGDNAYITEQMHVSYRRRLEKLSVHLAVAGRLLEALHRLEPYGRYRVLGDTVVRSAVQHAQVQVETGTPYGLPLEMCEEVFTEAARAIKEGRYPPLGAGIKSKVGVDSHHGWIWEEECPDNVFKRAFYYILQLDYGGGERPCTPDANEIAMLEKAARLLSLLLPESSRSALSHAHLVAVFSQAGAWRTRLSSSEFRISGTIFLSRRLLTNPWTAAEHLYHEALHQQFYDFRAGHLLLQSAFAREDAPLIHSPWNRPVASRNSYWDVHRALAAFHVYAHLALLCTAAEQDLSVQNEFGPMQMVGRRTALVRAHYLGEQIRKVASEELGPAGQRFVDWFGLVLELLDSSPPAAGADAHLLLDRYWRESTEIRLLPVEHYPEARDRLTILAEDEVRRTRQVLAAMSENTSSFDEAIAGLSKDDPGEYFASVRSLIATTILTASPENFRLSESGIPEGLVRQMVEDSSEVLRPLLDR